jgi:class 3 adenylate cyclase
MAVVETQTDPDFERRARLAVIWEDLINPVRAIVGYQEIILDEARRLKAPDILSYLDKVMISAVTLNDLVDALRDPAFVPAMDAGNGVVDLEGRLRHDLRTPLNAIIGYSEMVVEDLETSSGSEALRADIDRLLGEAKQLLDGIDAIVDLTRVDPRSHQPADAKLDSADAVVSSLLETLRSKETSKPPEVGRILIVDDNESNRNLLSRRLTLDGHTVVTAESGAATFAILENQTFDLILLDLLMPVMNGLEVLLSLKAEQRWRDISVIMVSGLRESDAVLKCIEVGAQDYLPKPCNVVLLRARINACLERERWRERERVYLAELELEKAKSDRLLRNILPHPVVLRLNEGETAIADGFSAASILFADIVGFTPAAASMTPALLVNKLDQVFSEFDALALDLGVEKIKTIGDAYMAATGLPEPRRDHVEAIAQFAIGMLNALERFETGDQPPLKIRIGVHTGPVVAGVIGRHKFIYDVWGDTVNIASRLESHGLPGRIHVSAEVRDALAHLFAFESRGTINLKGKGETPAFFLVPPTLRVDDL